MKVGIVGADGRKWSPASEELVKERIILILSMAQKLKSDFLSVVDIYSQIPWVKPMVDTIGYEPLVVISGHCPVGTEKYWCPKHLRFEVTVCNPNGTISYTRVYDQGGVDSLVEIIADELGIKKEIYPAEVHQWSSRWTGSSMLKGFLSRNIQIAEASDVLYVLSPECNVANVKSCSVCLPLNTYGKLKRGATLGHVYNGGLWTAQEAEDRDKKVVRISI